MPTKAKSNGHDSDEHTTIPLAVIEASKEITGAWNQQVASIIETGRVLKRHKDTLPRGYFGMVFDDANPEKPPFSDRTAQRLMKICEHRVLADPTHVSHLPPHWGTLYELSNSFGCSPASTIARHRG